MDIPVQFRPPLELGLRARERRRELGLSQAELGQRIGVGRQWIVAMESGKSRAELGLVLRAISALELSLRIDFDDRLSVIDEQRSPIAVTDNCFHTRRSPVSEEMQQCVPGKRAPVRQAN